jgi:hypothetical protein
VSSGPPLVVVPNIVTLSQADATIAVVTAGLTVGSVTTAASTTVPTGAVISQNPVAGTQVGSGSAVAFVVSSGPPASSLAVDQVISADGAGTQTTRAFSTLSAGEVLIAFVASDGPSTGGQTVTVSGAGLTWTLVQRANTQAGDAEIWKATAAARLSNVTVSSTPARGGFDQSLTIVAFSGASGIGASAAGGAASGAAALTLTTTKSGAFVYGVGEDWDRALSRSLSGGQTMVHEWVDTGTRDTDWVQALTGTAGPAGTSVQIAVTGPTTDRWNFAIVEIVP